MGADREPDNQHWYRSSTAVFWAGGIGLALIAGLVFTVVQMSDEWSKPITTVLTTTDQAATIDPTTSSPRTAFVVTPSDSSTSFTTSVPLSTTDIGIPPPIEATSGTETTEASSSAAPSPGFTAPTFPSQGRPSATEPDDGPTTTRKRPRFNETRTLVPRP